MGILRDKRKLEWKVFSLNVRCAALLSIIPKADINEIFAALTCKESGEGEREGERRREYLKTSFSAVRLMSGLFKSLTLIVR